MPDPAAGLAPSQPAAPDETERRNWMDDPFFQVSRGLGAASPEQIAQLEQAAQQVPDVESVVPALSVGGEG